MSLLPPPPLPEVAASPDIGGSIRSVCEQPGVLSELESSVRETGTVPCRFTQGAAWRELEESVLLTWRRCDHVIVRGLPALAEGASLLLASLSLPGEYKLYRGGKIVKTFRMSPWTKDLSHTLKEGHFHTDLNTEVAPPAVTAIQCLTPDPGAPLFGVNRVARLQDLLSFLATQGKEDTLAFLCDTTVTMVNDRSMEAWSGTIVKEGRIRFHPETLRAGGRRFKDQVSVAETCLAEIHAAALEVSTPFWLEEGDVLLVSNRRTLHYRGECSVVFTKYPLEFQARAIHVLHKMSEPQ